jgi:hypothetical protein
MTTDTSVSHEIASETVTELQEVVQPVPENVAAEENSEGNWFLNAYRDRLTSDYDQLGETHWDRFSGYMAGFLGTLGEVPELLAEAAPYLSAVGSIGIDGATINQPAMTDLGIKAMADQSEANGKAVSEFLDARVQNAYDLMLIIPDAFASVGTIGIDGGMPHISYDPFQDNIFTPNENVPVQHRPEYKVGQDVTTVVGIAEGVYSLSKLTGLLRSSDDIVATRPLISAFDDSSPIPIEKRPQMKKSELESLYNRSSDSPPIGRKAQLIPSDEAYVYGSNITQAQVDRFEKIFGRPFYEYQYTWDDTTVMDGKTFDIGGLWDDLYPELQFENFSLPDMKQRIVADYGRRAWRLLAEMDPELKNVVSSNPIEQGWHNFLNNFKNNDLNS